MPDRLRITFFGTYDERQHPRVQVLRQGLADTGHEVSVVNAPLDVDTAGRVKIASQPWRAPLLMARLLGKWAQLLWRSRRIHRPDVVVVGYLGQFDVHLARGRWPRAHLVLDHLVPLADTVRDRGLDRERLVGRALQLIDRAATAQADRVVVDTTQQAEQIYPRHRWKVVVVPVGAPRAWFAARRSASTDLIGTSGREAREPLKVVFFGLFTPLQGAPTIGRAIRHLAHRDVTWTMIGKGQDRDATMREAGDADVTWIDWVDTDTLAAAVAAHDVCLGIFGTGPKARRVVPNKVYQGAAAGCAVVTSNTEPQRAALGDVAVYTPPGDAEALAAALAVLVDDREALTGRRRAASDLAAREFSPRSVVAGLVAALGRAHDEEMSSRASAQPPLPPNAALRWHLVDEHLLSIAPSSILECGAGQGSVGARLATRATYVGVEPDETSRATAGARLPSSARLLGSLSELDDETFDLVCAFEVLEHIEDDRAALKEWVERVTPGGHVLVSVPADPERFAPADELAGHFRRYSTDDLAALFESAGLSTISIEHYGFPLGLALEAGRNTIARRRLAREPVPSDVASRTAGSGRHLQPPDWSGRAIWWATAPFRRVQRRYSDRGPGLVGLARRPD